MVPESRPKPRKISHKNARDALRRVRLFQGLTATQLKWLAERAQIREIESDERIVGYDFPSTSVFFLLRGTVKICAQRRFDHEVVFDILGPGEAIGDLHAIDGAGHSANVVTLETSCVASLSCAEFREALVLITPLSQNLIAMLARRLRRRTGQAEILAALDVCGRLAYHLLLYAEDYGVRENDGLLLPLHLSQTELGGLIGASRERVNRALNYFRRQNYLTLRADGYIVIHDTVALSQRHPRL